MITPDMIAFILASFCQVKNPNITKQAKLDCIEFHVNCVVRENGETTKEIMNECRERWADIERKRK